MLTNCTMLFCMEICAPKRFVCEHLYPSHIQKDPLDLSSICIQKHLYASWIQKDPQICLMYAYKSFYVQSTKEMSQKSVLGCIVRDQTWCMYMNQCFVHHTHHKVWPEAIPYDTYSILIIFLWFVCICTTCLSTWLVCAVFSWPLHGQVPCNIQNTFVHIVKVLRT